MTKRKALTLGEKQRKFTLMNRAMSYPSATLTGLLRCLVEWVFVRATDVQ